MKKTLRKWMLLTSIMATLFAVGGCALNQTIDEKDSSAETNGSVVENAGESNSESDSESSDSVEGEKPEEGGGTEGGGTEEGGEEKPKEDLADKYEHISISEAIALAQAAGETATTESYVIVGTVKTVKNATYGEMVVEDESGELYIYGSMAADGTYYDQMTDKPVKGDTVVLRGVLRTYNGTPQMGEKNVKAVIVDWYHPEVEINPSEYESVEISVAREKAEGSKVQVSGVVAAIAYANGKIATGVILVDGTSSIYVFDKDVAGQVQVGNQITVAATKTYWILGTEESNAALYGYKGACQLESALLVSNDKDNHEFDKSWIEEITVKELMNTPFDENVTTLLYKTTALVEKKEGTGFVNYYIKDLDGQTGSYTYTQCNGSDFAWLNDYDGKICTVYLTALNAKSTPAECFYRLLPVQVEEIASFAYPEEDIPAFAIEYGVMDLFGEEYGANPALQLPNGYSNDLIGAEGVALSYTVSDESVAEIVAGSEYSTLNLLASGRCEVTVTATYKTYSASVTKTVVLNAAEQIVAPTVAEVIAKEDDAQVKVRGIVMSSLVNRDGFYLGDETGMIAVLTNKETLAKIKPGDEVVFEGYKVHFKKATSTSIAGQCAIVGSVTRTAESVNFTSDAKLLANYFGDNEYSTSYFIEDKTIDDLYALDIQTDYTNNVYKISAKVIVEKTAYYSNIYLQDEGGTNTFGLYSSSAAQYAWLQAYAGQVVEMEIAVCNWNDKKNYKGCVLSVTVDGKKIFNTLNFDN